jgi:hypothetical protein
MDRLEEWTPLFISWYLEISLSLSLTQEFSLHSQDYKRQTNRDIAEHVFVKNLTAKLRDLLEAY